jgi:cysteine desulfurase
MSMTSSASIHPTHSTPAPDTPDTMRPPIYLDYNATTPVDPAVLLAMRPYLERQFGNPSSGHLYGEAARAAVEAARAQVAALLECAPEEIVFTGGGSESDNYALKGVAFARRARDGGDHLITSQIEHPAVLATCRYLEERHGYRVTYLPVDKSGMVDPAAVEAAISSETILISIMHANNEVGTLEPIAEIGRIARRHGIALHTDAAQSVGKVPVQVDELGVDLLTVVGHKLYAPKGIGALYVRSGTMLDPLIHGAGHEGGRRAGTENVPYIVALGAACALAKEQLADRAARWQELRARLLSGLEARVGPVQVNGHLEWRLPNTLNICVPGVVGEEVLTRAHRGCLHRLGMPRRPDGSLLSALGNGRRAQLGVRGVAPVLRTLDHRGGDRRGR